MTLFVSVWDTAGQSCVYIVASHVNIVTRLISALKYAFDRRSLPELGNTLGHAPTFLSQIRSCMSLTDITTCLKQKKVRRTDVFMPRNRLYCSSSLKKIPLLLWQHCSVRASLSVRMFHFRNKKAVPLHAMEAHGGEEEKLLFILNLGTRWGVSGQRHAPAALYPRGKEDRRLGGPQSRSGRRG
jgi:hypothetical protein